MTTTCLYVTSKFAAMASDTLISGTEGDGAVYMSKSYSLPHARVLFGFTGLRAAAECMHHALNSGSDGTRSGDIDDFAEHGEAIAREAIERVESVFRFHGVEFTGSETLGEAYLAGWSRRRERVTGYLIDLDAPDAGARPIPDDRLICIPSLWGRKGTTGAVSIPADFVAAFREAYECQHDGMYCEGDGPHLGGDMLLSVLTEREIRSIHIGTFANATDSSAWSRLETELARVAA
ncbi:MAG: hypothetical protein RLO51_16845 [Thalassobaculum sp.]|uniref:hypothetical protein n=1 Tax=Thalassobaculum sp. TaxID=2022740 RepID=UPI0032EC1A44